MKKIFTSKLFKTIILPLIPMVFWGSLFPFIKIGYKTLNIDATSVPDILMFAAVRFIISGIIVCIIASFTIKKEERPTPKIFGSIVIMGMFSIVLHYAFTYMGLGITDSSKTALLKQFAPLLYSCFAFLFIKTEKFNILKILGALVGFAGIVAINLGTDVRGLSFGDVLILSASVCSVISMVMSWHIVKKTNPFWITAISQTVGGIILLCAALVLGAQFPVFTLESTLVFTYICIASIVGYVLFGFAQKYSDMTKLFIIKFTEPLIACVFGAVLLGEDILKIQYLVAFVLITAGILLGNRETNNESKDSRN